MEKPSLILITASYPFNHSEPYIAQELAELSQAFSVTIIARTNTINSQREVPAGVKIVNLPSKMRLARKVFLFLKLISRYFPTYLRLLQFEYQELTRLKKEKTVAYLLQITHDIIKGIDFKEALEHYIAMNPQGESLVLYNYWLNNDALGTALYASNTVKIARTHGADLFFERSPTNYLSFQRYKVNQLDSLFFVSDEGLSYWQQTIGDSNQLTVCKLATPPQEKLPIATNRIQKLIISCSNVIPLKRIDFIIKSLAYLENLSISWVHFGNGTEFSVIQELAEDYLKGKPDVHYQLKGQTQNAEILAFYKANLPDLFLHASETEGGCPVAIQEAISFGIPVIAVDTGGVKGVVGARNGALLPSTAQPKDLTNAIELFFAKTIEEQEVLRDNSYRIWKKNHNPALNNLKLIQTIQNLLETKKTNHNVSKNKKTLKKHLIWKVRI